jgi:hypothetical protein
MDKLNAVFYKLAHNYLLITIAAVLFFAVKSAAAFITYRHFNRRMANIERKLEQMSSQLARK